MHTADDVDDVVPQRPTETHSGLWAAVCVTVVTHSGPLAHRPTGRGRERIKNWFYLSMKKVKEEDICML